MTVRKVASRTGFYVLIALFVAGSLFPFYWIVITSLKTQGELTNGTTSSPSCRGNSRRRPSSTARPG
jgi:ABC-type glycerol-3-phosphate transport system permease component